MEQVIPPEQLAARVFALEQETAWLRQRVEQLSPQTGASEKPKPKVRFVDQQLITDAIDRFFKELGIDTQPVNIHALQEQMRAAGFETNEFSRGIIEMRDE